MKFLAGLTLGVVLTATVSAHAEPYTRDVARIAQALERLVRVAERCK